MQGSQKRVQGEPKEVDNITEYRYNKFKGGDVMNVNYLVAEKNISKYNLSKSTGIPYSTISDICSGKTSLEKCNAKTVYELSRFFEVSMEDLLYKDNEFRVDFETFKSNVRHKFKESGYKKFIISVLKDDEITEYASKRQFPEALYLLAMLDYVSRLNGVALCTKYNSLRKAKLKEVVYPASVLAEAKIMNDESILQKSIDESIPEFIRFNIVESEVFDVA